MIELQTVPPPTADTEGVDVVAAAAVGVEDEEDADGGISEADDEDVDAWSPGLNGASPNGHDAWGRAGGAGGSNDPLPDRVQPEGPPAVVPPVAEGPHAYVGAALRLVVNSPPSRALTRLQAYMRQP